MPLPSAWAAHDFRVTLPKHSRATPVQQLNRDGVEAVRKQHFEKAEALFWKAYLYDPSDPFTLNNLGYISEIQGKLDRALKFYQLAAQQGTDAAIDRSNTKQLEGKPLETALTGLKDAPLRVNHLNVQAVALLSENRTAEATRLLQQALAADPKNSFTLNNLGVAREAVGDYDGALRYYAAAAAARSAEPIVVTLDRSTRGKGISEMAAESARRLDARMHDASTAEAQASLLAVRGVSAANQNDWDEAKKDFLKAYSLDPGSAFALNNLGYVSERDGDIETAHFFYSKAQRADGANARVGLATESDAEGKHLVVVADDSDQKVNHQIDEYRRARRGESGTIELERRDGSPADNAAPAPDAPNSPTAPELVPRSAEPPSAGPGTAPPTPPQSH